jgi:hypothetical protein
MQKIQKAKVAKKVTKLGKFRTHCICIGIGLAFTVGITYLSPSLMHVAAILPVVPSFIQEAFDRIANW